MHAKDRSFVAGELLLQRIRERQTNEHLVLGRNTCLGGAAAALVIVSQIIQVGAKGSLEFSLICCAIAMPIFIALSVMYEVSIAIGPESYPFARVKPIEKIHGLLFLLAGGTLLLAIFAALWYLSTPAALIFGVFSGVAFLAVTIFWAWISSWYRANYIDTRDPSG